MHVSKSSPTALHPDKATPQGRPPMRSRRKTQTPVPSRGILQRNPKANSARRVRVQERAVLMRGHPPTDLGLLANDHALEHARVAEPQRPRDGRIRRSQRRGAKRCGESVQTMPDFVYGAVGGFAEGAGGWGEGSFFKEEADLVPACEEVFVADVGGGFARGEPR